MSKSEITENGSCEETWAMRQQGRGLVAPSRKSSCRCGRCRIYRFYPPLLVASTALTAVFCFLYLTKPVFQEAPAMRVDDGGGAGLRQPMIAGTGPAEVQDEPEIRPGLDPGFVMFPDQARVVDPVVAALSTPEPLDVLDVPAMEPEISIARPAAVPEPAAAPDPDPVVSRDEQMRVRVSTPRRSDSPAVPVPGGFQPMEIEPASAPLFQSLTKADLARLEARRNGGVAAYAGGDSGADQDQALADAEDGDAGDQPDEGEPAAEVAEAFEIALAAFGNAEFPDGEGGEDSNEPVGALEDVPVLRASLIGEFYEDNQGDGDEEQSMLKTAMR